MEAGAPILLQTIADAPAALAEALLGISKYVIDQIAATPWGDWHGFWLRHIFDDRFLVCYFLPLLPLLMLFPPRQLRLGIVLTGVAFLLYVFGPLHVVLWLASCIMYFYLGEIFVRECRRTDVLAFGPPLAAGALVVCTYLISQLLQHIPLPDNVNAWLFEHLTWVFPLGARDVRWEPFWMPHRPEKLFRAALWNPHNIGTAYLTVRMLHYFSELKRGGIPAERRTLGNFLAWLCYAPTLMQGPIERYLPFQDEMNTCHERRGWRNLPPAAARIGWGIAKCVFATRVFVPVLRDQLGLGGDNRFYNNPAAIENYALLYFGVFLQIYALYLEFSGYCDVSAGMARLLGYRQVENFNWPWLATSMRDFWRRWHISLSLILRDYVYIPLGGGRRSATRNLCITFVICGVWHVPTPAMAVWGLVMGLMLAINQHWAHWMERLDKAPSGILPAVRRACVRLRPLPTIFSWLVTMHAFVFSLLIFFGSSGGRRVSWELLRRPLYWMTSADVFAHALPPAG